MIKINLIQTQPINKNIKSVGLDLCSFETRLPLAPIKENTKVIVKNAMRFAGLIN